MINGVSAASESSPRIRSPMEFPWLLYWISFKFVTLSGAMLIAARYESSRLRGVHLSFRGEESLRAAAASNSTLFCALGTIHTFVKLLSPVIQSPFRLLFRKWIYYLAGASRLSRANARPQNTAKSLFLKSSENLGMENSEFRFFSRFVLNFTRWDRLISFYFYTTRFIA